MRSRQAILLLAIVSLAATVVALTLQTYFGRLFWLVASGPVLAAAGGAAIALSLKKRP
jgi:membrane protein required for beta-lactamase induction